MNNPYNDYNNNYSNNNQAIYSNAPQYNNNPGMVNPVLTSNSNNTYPTGQPLNNPPTNYLLLDP